MLKAYRGLLVRPDATLNSQVSEDIDREFRSTGSSVRSLQKLSACRREKEDTHKALWELKVFSDKKCH